MCNALCYTVVAILQENFGMLNHLLSLDLSSNQLKTLPEAFGKLSLLQKLDLYSNQLTFLPLSFWQLKKLRWLDLKKNPLEDDLKEAAGKCVSPQDCTQCANQVCLCACVCVFISVLVLYRRYFSHHFKVLCLHDHI